MILQPQEVFLVFVDVLRPRVLRVVSQDSIYATIKPLLRSCSLLFTYHVADIVREAKMGGISMLSNREVPFTMRNTTVPDLW
jgi:hypothetical protein